MQVRQTRALLRAVAQHLLGTLDRPPPRPRNVDGAYDQSLYAHTLRWDTEIRRTSQSIHTKFKLGHLHSDYRVSLDTLTPPVLQELLGSLTKFIPMRGIRAAETRQQMIDAQIRIDGWLVGLLPVLFRG